ncbi:hypothetical protein HON59_02950 [bacterium]|mgnify:CR=1 FL=1|jgi:hypothetical protein|nr:hypothetical protein [bacterium]MBT4894990.1 hypothetical protein [bacterium]
MNTLITWDIYEITTEESEIHGVMLRGRIRKFAIQNNINLLAENASDLPNVVRFAVQYKEDVSSIISFIKSIVHDSSVALISESVPNPVLSKTVVNIEDRYTI